LFLIPDAEFVTNYIDDVVEIDKWPILLRKYCVNFLYRDSR